MYKLNDFIYLLYIRRIKNDGGFIDKNPRRSQVKILACESLTIMIGT